MIDKATFGARLKVARRNAGITQKELASFVNAKHNSVSNWENGQNMPDPDTIVDICEALNVSAGFLLGNETPDAEVPKLSAEALSLAQDFDRLDEEHKRLARGFMELLKGHMR